MPTQDHTLLLASAVFGVLVIASSIGLVLKLKIAGDGPHLVIDNLNSRIKAWWMMVAVIGLALWSGRTVIILLFAFTSFVALREYMTIAPTRRADHWALVLSFFVALPFQYFLIWIEW